MDRLVIGCGLSGAVLARHFAEQGNRVTIWERRNHILSRRKGGALERET